MSISDQNSASPGTSRPKLTMAMYGFEISPFTVLIVLLVALHLNQNMPSPSSALAVSGGIWADEPCPLIATPQYVTKKVE